MFGILFIALICRSIVLQRSKNLPRTGAIDLPTLEKLDQYTLGPLKVRKVIKSKLDDISGNFPGIRCKNNRRAGTQAKDLKRRNEQLSIGQ
jgi:hypothetical protein